MAALVDKYELLEKCQVLLLVMEEELYRENHSLVFNDAWSEFEAIVDDLRAEVDDDY